MSPKVGKRLAENHRISHRYSAAIEGSDDPVVAGVHAKRATQPWISPQSLRMLDHRLFMPPDKAGIIPRLLQLKRIFTDCRTPL